MRFSLYWYFSVWVRFAFLAGLHSSRKFSKQNKNTTGIKTSSLNHENGNHKKHLGDTIAKFPPSKIHLLTIFSQLNTQDIDHKVVVFYIWKNAQRRGKVTLSILLAIFEIYSKHKMFGTTSICRIIPLLKIKFQIDNRLWESARCEVNHPFLSSGVLKRV